MRVRDRIAAEPRRAPVGAEVGAAPELERPFRLIAFDWDGTAVASRSADASRVGAVIDRVLAIGVRIAVVTGTSLSNIARQLLPFVATRNRPRLFLATNRGSEVYGFDRRGEVVVLWRRVASEDEERRLDLVAEEVRARLERLTSLPVHLVYDRLNRRKIDLIPVPEWSDPPKSAIGELLTATEARLRGAGLRGGLREAFELTQHVAGELALDARVTSDVKHIEVGLTDKSDAIVYILREIAAPLDISPERVLIVGDEFGPIGGFEGSDRRMLAPPEIKGAVVVSVGAEPGGAPENVVHLGGGPDRFIEILEQQLALEARLGPFAPPRDAAWVVEDSGFYPPREHEVESLLAIGNGYMGSRASIAEGSSASRPATFIAGAFEPSADRSQVPELVIAPDWGRLKFVIQGQPLSVEAGIISEHRRSLDLRRGVLLRECIAACPGGYVVDLRTLHLASLADRHLLIEGVDLVPVNFTGFGEVEGILSGDVRSASGATHWATFEAAVNHDELELTGRTRRGFVASMTSRMHVRREEAELPLCFRRTGESWASERCELSLRLGQHVDLWRTVTLHTSRDASDPRAAGDRLRERLATRSIDDLLRENDEAWAVRWRAANVEIDGAPKIDRALRFALYHLIASANPEDPRSSIGARALTGEAYRGHVFWDTETFMLPFYVYTWPDAARSLLLYRHRTLEGARRKAKDKGYHGALYAWESADTGDETTPAILITPFGEVMRVLSGEQEHHISADIAYAVCQYVRATGDTAFMAHEGLEILVETARFWASRVRIDDVGAHIDLVMGPDEYHESIHDNAFTNWMARYNLLQAAQAWERFGAGRPELEVSLAEVESWRDIADHLVLLYDRASALIEQFAGFLRLEQVDLASFTSRTAPLDVLLGRERTQGSQVIKQSDVVQLIAMFWDEIDAATRRASFLYYEPRTAHGSSLSPGIHALVAARLGLSVVAARYLDQTADIDLGNTMGNAAGGVHAAALGSLWQAIVFGVAGVRPSPHDEGALLFEPHLLPGWRHVGFPLSWRGAMLEAHLEPGALEIVVSGERTARIAVGPSSPPLTVEPGRRYVARLEGERAKDFQETRG